MGIKTKRKPKEVVVDDAILDKFQEIIFKLKKHADEVRDNDKDEMWFVPITKEMAKFLEKAFEIKRGVKRCKRKKR